MSTINTVENLRLWFLSCPEIDTILNFNADYIGSKAKECSIYSMPSNLRYTEDVVGNITYTVRQVRNFIFAMRLPHSNDVEQNLDNVKFFDDVQDWMYAQNTDKNFPEISEGTVVSIMPIKTQYLVDSSSDNALYEMQISLTYDRNDT